MLTPLHVRSGYSLLRGAAMPERLIALAKWLEYRRLALTDVNSLYAATLFYRQADEAGIEPITGAELLDCGPAGQGNIRAGETAVPRAESPAANGELSVVALVTEETGYENLCRIITRIHRRRGEAAQPEADSPFGDTWSARPETDLPADLAQLHQGLQLIVEEPRDAQALLAAGVPAERLWLGLDPATQPHAQLRRLSEGAERLSLPLVATAKALLAEPADLEVARLLAAIRLGSSFEQVDAGLLPHPAACLRRPAELHAQLAYFPQAIHNNQRLTEMCRYRLLPRRPVFPGFACPDGLSAVQYLHQLCQEGLRRRYGDDISEVAHARLQRELRLIQRLGFCEYFLVVWDIVQCARRLGAPVAGRGSGASSLAAYVLGITNVCPIAFDIPFERFLNEGREDFPDLDVDFCWRIRDQVIAYAIRRWGSDHVAMVSMHGTFQPASALRETAKAFGMSNEQVSQWENQEAEFATRVGHGHAEHSHANNSVAMPPGKPKRSVSLPPLPRIVQLSKRILGLPHNLSVHPGGIVIGQKPIDHYVPLQPAMKGVMITQFDKNGVEDIRLVKLDLLGNRNLSTIRHACELISRRRGIVVDTENLPADAATLKSLQDADTVGCNQLESPAMRHLLRMMQPKGRLDVMKALALIRPGAASIGMKEVFVRRHRGLEEIPPGQPSVDAILGGTHGVMLYEDDVLLVAAALLGGTMAQADRFRKAVQKCKDDQRRLELSRQFLAGCRANGIDLEYAKGLWVQMAKFNAYSFCRAHAASYAQLAYAGAHLKAHYPLEFWVAALNNNQSMYPVRVYVEQARRAGVGFLLPDVNASQEEFAIEGDAVRVGFSRVSGLGPVSAQGILAQRAAGPFEGLTDFLLRTRLGREEARSLILCGAFDCTGTPRPGLMIELDLALSNMTRQGRHLRSAGRSRGAPSIPRAGRLLTAHPVLPDVGGDYPYLRKYMDERQILGLSTRGHIMGLYRPHLEGQVSADSRDIPASVGRRVRIAGVLEALRTTPTQKGETMMFMTLDDELGLFETTVFPDVYRRGDGVKEYGPYIVTGKVEDQYGAITVSAEKLELFAAQPKAVAL